MVASTHPPLRLADWKHFFLVLWPRVVSTAITLLKGVAVGAVFGIVGLLGLPFVIGAVLTSGLAYVWASSTRHNISTYVALIGGLSLFERLASLEVVETWTVIREIATTIVLAGGGTLLGLALGWGVGFVVGSVTRGCFCPGRIGRCKARPTILPWSTGGSASSCGSAAAPSWRRSRWRRGRPWPNARWRNAVCGINGGPRCCRSSATARSSSCPGGRWSWRRATT